MRSARLAGGVAGLLVLLGGCTTAPASQPGHGTPGPSASPPLAASPVAPAPSPSGPPAPIAPLTLSSVAFGNPMDGWAVGTTSVGSADLLFSSTKDGGATWSPTVSVTTLADVTTGVGETVRFADAHHGWISGQGLLSTLDGGQTWTPAALKGLVGPAAPAGNSVWALQSPCGRTPGTCAWVLVQSRIGSTVWRPAANQPSLPAGSADLLRVSASEAFIIDTPSEPPTSPTLHRTRDGGTTWQALTNPCGWASSESLASLDGVHTWIACGYGPAAGNELKSIFVSGDSGVTWHPRAGTGVPGTSAPTPTGALGTGGYVSGLTLLTSTTAILNEARFGLMRSTDGGVTWRDANPVGPADNEFLGNVWFVDPEDGWLTNGTGGWPYGWPGLFRTSDGGQTWSQVATSR